jgi:hypothetical protein
LWMKKLWSRKVFLLPEKSFLSQRNVIYNCRGRLTMRKFRLIFDLARKSLEMFLKRIFHFLVMNFH